MKKLKCRFCTNEFEHILDLRFHVANSHHGIYMQDIIPHLHKVVEKLCGLESIAKDCTKGYRESTPGKRQYNGNIML